MMRNCLHCYFLVAVAVHLVYYLRLSHDYCAVGELLVNFDKAMMQLIRETKHLQRMGIEVPESARQVLNQEEKFKLYFNQLTYALKVHSSHELLCNGC